MLSLPLHDLDQNEAQDFKAYLNKASVPERYFIIALKTEIVVFKYKEQAENYKKAHNLIEDVRKVKKLSSGFTYNVAPCLYCSSQDFKTDDLKKVEMRFFEQSYIEDLYLNTAKDLFQKQKVSKLFTVAKDLLEHQNPENTLAHFYLGFCFFAFKDQDNLNQAIKNLEQTDPELAAQLIKISS